MKKIWLLVLPILLCILSCEGFTTTGSNDPYSDHCYGISKKNAYSYMLFFELDCPYGENCKTSLSFIGSGVWDTLDSRCFSGYELRLETADTSRIVLENKNYPILLTPDNHANFTFIGEDNEEKKYDIDLSGIINSYTVRGDSVVVNVMDNCRITVISTPQNIEVYGNVYPESNFIFSANESIRSWFGYDCIWHEQGPLKKDDLNIHAEIFWTK